MSSQVSKRTFVRAMGERGSVILVPGGQAELLYTGRLTQNKEFVIYPRHKGVQWLSPCCRFAMCTAPGPGFSPWWFARTVEPLYKNPLGPQIFCSTNKMFLDSVQEHLLLLAR